jgi:hypothetical protein
MLPGFRFLFTAIVLSLSILVFGLGAAALFRAAHEQFASMPSRRATPEPVFAQQREAPAPTLALLRVDPPVVEKVPENVPTAVAPDEPAADAAPPAGPEKLAALKVEDAPPPEAAKPEPSNAEPSIPETSKPEAAETTSAIPSASAQAEAPASSDTPKLAAIAEAPPPIIETAPIAAEPAVEALAPEVSIASTKIATLGGPAVTIEQTAAAKADATPDRSAAAKRTRERRRIARRARVARQAVAAQQPASPFAQPAVTPRSR